MSAWNRSSERRCVCGHDKSLHAYTATGLGACSGVRACGDCACPCKRFTTYTERRRLRAEARHKEAVAQARAAYAAALNDEGDAGRLVRAVFREPPPLFTRTAR